MDPPGTFAGPHCVNLDSEAEPPWRWLRSALEGLARHDNSLHDIGISQPAPGLERQ